MSFKTLLACAGFSILFASSACFAQSLYKYKDEHGRWIFTDSPPVRSKPQKFKLSNSKNKSRNPSGATSASSSRDLAQLLDEQIQPKNPIETASMAVVAIKTHTGSGSGFFVSNKGHIITNRHVIRVDDRADDQKQKYEDTAAYLQKKEKRLGLRKKRIQDYKKDLERYAADIGENYKTSTEPRIIDGKEELADYQKEYKAELEQFKAMNKDFQKEYKDFKWRNSMANIASSFTVILKNGTKLKAQLIYISDKQDLALLQLKNHTTPLLTVGPLRSMAQGDQVYAIGSPLGQKDSVSAGILTSLSANNVITDSQILPGNSGGPLINTQGQVVAINTARISEVRGGAGFGHSIPIDLAMQELQRFLPSPSNL